MVGGSSDELDRWVLETAPRAVAYARSLLRDPHQAEDIVQDCYCRLLAKSGTYDLPNDGLKLLLTAITNATINLRTRRKPVLSLVRPKGRYGDFEQDDPPDPHADAPDELAVASELNAAVAVALRLLPSQQRAAVELKSLGYSQQDLADILGVSISNAGVLLHRGRQALARHLAPFLGTAHLPNGEDAS